MNVVTRGIRNAFRNTIRTFSIVAILGLITGLSLAMLIAYQSVGQKIASVKALVGNTVSVSPAGVRGFEGGGNALTISQLAPLRSLRHVVAVNESLNDRLTTSDTNLQSAISAGTLGQRFSRNNGQSFFISGEDSLKFRNGSGPTLETTFTPPVPAIGTTDPTNLAATAGGGTFALQSGSIFGPSETGDVALIGSGLAAKNNLTIGSTFKAYTATITVAGIFSSGNTFSNNQIIMPLATLQNLSGQQDEITQATITVDSVTNIDSVTRAVQKQLGGAADVTNDATMADQAIVPLEDIQTMSLYSFIGALGAGGIILLLTMVMIVRERRREIGVIKAIGASNLRIMIQFMVEAMTLTLLGAVIGIILAVAVSAPITQLLVTSSSTTSQSTTVPNFGGGFLRVAGGAGTALRSLRSTLTNINTAVGWNIILYGLGAALLIAIVGSTLASLFIAKIRPAEVMREE